MQIKQGTFEWELWRRQGIGATDASAICGYSKWDTALSIYVKKTTERPKPEQTSYQEWGNRIEPILIDKLCDEEPHVTNVERGNLYVHHDISWAKCSLDGECVANGEKYIIECKTARSANDWSPVPDGYYAQVQWQMFVTGYRHALFSVLVGGVDWFSRLIEYDPQFANNMYNKCNAFWNDLQIGKAPREIQNGEIDCGAICELARNGTEKGVELEIPQKSALRYMLLKKELEAAQKAFDDCKAEITLMMRNGETLTYEGTKFASYVTRAGSITIDRKLLEKKYPDVFEDVKKQGMSTHYVKYNI